MYGTWSCLFSFEREGEWGWRGLVLLKLSMLLCFYDAVSSTLKDAMELDQLISHLINKEDSEGVVLLGHSTGCQVSTSCIIS